MRLSPLRRRTVNFFSSATLLFGGSFGGTHLTAMVAPYSDWNGLVGFLMFPTAFIASMRLWPFITALWAKHLASSKTIQSSKKAIPKYIQRIIGSLTFVVVSILISILAGLILTPPAMQIAVDPGYNILIPAGTMYGVVCWIFIQLGYLQQIDISSGA